VPHIDTVLLAEGSRQPHSVVPDGRAELDDARKLAERVVHARLCFSRHHDVAVLR
jgi:hypothetical protein